MVRHLFANLWLLAVTLGLCCVVYPILLLGIGQLPLFKDKAEGSLIHDDDGKVIGSRLEAKSYEDDEYFWPRPSAASYKADGSSGGGSNYSANNPALRQRVENQLGTVLKYGRKGAKPGKMIGPDIEAWFAGKKGLVAQWAQRNPALAQTWVKENKLIARFIDAEKEGKLAKKVRPWLTRENKEGAKISAIKAEDLAVPFLTWYSENYAGTWPTVQEKDMALVPITRGNEIRAFFYVMWREAHPSEDLDPVPADMVTTSGSGLDPHITMKNADYQFDRVADKWAELKKLPRPEVAAKLRKVLNDHKHAPLGGLAGVEMINVMEVNRALENGTFLK